MIYIYIYTYTEQLLFSNEYRGLVLTSPQESQQTKSFWQAKEEMERSPQTAKEKAILGTVTAT